MNKTGNRHCEGEARSNLNPGLLRHVRNDESASLRGRSLKQSIVILWFALLRSQ